MTQRNGDLLQKAGIIGGLMLLAYLVFDAIFPPLANPPELIWRTQCKNNLQQIALAILSYHDEYGTLPPACVLDDDGRPAHSWRVLILPYLDEESLALYEQYRFDEPWNGPNNSELAKQIPETYRCPSFVRNHEDHEIAATEIGQLTNYVAINDPEGLFDGARSVSNSDATDGFSHTIMVVEVHAHAVHWMQPEDVTEPEFLFDLRGLPGTRHGDEGSDSQVLFGDGSVKLIQPNIDRELFHKLITRSGGDPVRDF